VAKFEWCVLKECVRECVPNISKKIYCFEMIFFSDQLYP